MKLLEKLSLSYMTKLTVVCILLVTLPLSAIGAVTASRITTYMGQSIQARADQTAGYLDERIDEMFTKLMELTLLPIFDSSMQEVLTGHAENGSGQLLFEDQKKIVSFLTGMYFDNPIISRARLYLMDGSFISTDGQTYKWRQADLPWLETCKTDHYRTFILPVDGEIVMCRALESPMLNRETGYIEVVLNQNRVEQAIKSIALAQDGQIFILNEFGDCVYPIGADVGELKLLQESSSGYRYSSVTSSSTKLELYVKISTAAIEQENRMLYGQLMSIWVVMLLLGVAFAYYASQQLTRPILSLKDKMELVSEGRFDTRMMVQSKDEIGQLEAMFNSMTESVETLITEVYEESIANREAQISALQSQINPHFLYNTLETINMMAISAENYDISQAVSDLGWMMRYCVSNEKHFAELEEEFRFVSTYYDIMRMRFDNLRSLTITADDGCRALMVPKLLLQPFIENIMQHGTCGRPIDIALEASRQGNELTISIENNGAPLTEEAKALLHSKFSEAERESAAEHHDGKGYGLGNVHRRLRLIYGKGCGVFLDEQFTQGARFIIKLRLA